MAEDVSPYLRTAGDPSDATYSVQWWTLSSDRDPLTGFGLVQVK
jgi:hypothetical protein